MLVQVYPTLAESLQYIGQQKIAGLIFITVLVDLLVFPMVGLIGIVFAAVGFALGRIGTEVIVLKAIIKAEGQE
jgi:hypothetical protein